MRHVERQNVDSSAEVVSRKRGGKSPPQRGKTLGVADEVGDFVREFVLEDVRERNIVPESDEDVELVGEAVGVIPSGGAHEAMTATEPRRPLLEVYDVKKFR